MLQPPACGRSASGAFHIRKTGPQGRGYSGYNFYLLALGGSWQPRARPRQRYLKSTVLRDPARQYLRGSPGHLRPPLIYHCERSGDKRDRVRYHLGKDHCPPKQRNIKTRVTPNGDESKGRGVITTQKAIN